MSSGGKVSQGQLAAAWREAGTRGRAMQFQKADAVAGFPIPANARGLADLPTPVRDVLGRVDRTKYTDAYIRQHRGDHVIVQFKKDGTPDLYISGNSRQTYQVLADGGAQGRTALQQAADLGLEPGALQLLRKRQLTEMRATSHLGAPNNRAMTIDAPWGGTQTKPVGTDAFIVKNGDEFYMVQRDAATGLPIGYIRPDSTPVAAGPFHGGGQAAGGSLFGL